MVWIYTIGKKFLTVKGTTLGLSKSSNNCAYWQNKTKAKSWLSNVTTKYPKAELVPATIVPLKIKKVTLTTKVKVV